MKTIFTAVVILTLVLSACAPVSAPAAQQQTASGNAAPAASKVHKAPQPTLVPDSKKPSLPAAKWDECNKIANTNINVREAVGYIFPESQTLKLGPVLALWAAPVQKPVKLTGIASNNEDAVGVVGIADSTNKGTYIVTIDLTKADKGTDTTGSLINCDTTKKVTMLTFSAKPQTPNPVRKNWKIPGPNTIDVSIGADRVCFLHVLDGSMAVRLCETTQQLSVKALFESRYSDLQNIIQSATSAAGLDDNVNADEIISEAELPANIEKCTEKEKCQPEIIGAPVKQTVTGQQDGNCWETVGIVQVVSDLKLKNTTIKNGNYAVNYWYTKCDQNNKPDYTTFYAATLSNSTTEDLQIPSVPAAYCDVVDNNGQCISTAGPRSEISAWHLGSGCLFWQIDCP